MEYRPSIVPKIVVALCVAAVPIGFLSWLFYLVTHTVI
jgi:hypothetical protein